MRTTIAWRPGGRLLADTVRVENGAIVCDIEIDGADVVRLGDVTVDAARRIVLVGLEDVPLTPKEFDVLYMLAQRAGEAVSRRDLYERVWALNPDIVRTRSLDVIVHTLRRKLAPFLTVESVRGFGYRVVAGETIGDDLPSAA